MEEVILIPMTMVAVFAFAAPAFAQDPEISGFGWPAGDDGEDEEFMMGPVRTTA